MEKQKVGGAIFGRKTSGGDQMTMSRTEKAKITRARNAAIKKKVLQQQRVVDRANEGARRRVSKIAAIAGDERGNENVRAVAVEMSKRPLVLEKGPKEMAADLLDEGFERMNRAHEMKEEEAMSKGLQFYNAAKAALAKAVKGQGRCEEGCCGRRGEG